MGLFGRIIKDAISDGLSKAVGKAVEKAAAPVAEKWANKAAENLNEAAGRAEETQKAGKSSLESAFANLESAAKNYSEAVTDASVNLFWENYMAGMPKYTGYTTGIDISESGTNGEGNPVYEITIKGTNETAFNVYLLELKRNGYLNYYPNSDETMYKPYNGYVLGFNQTDARYDDDTYSFRVWRASSKEKLH